MNKSKIVINGEQHDLVFLKVLSLDEAGRPSTVQVGYDDTVFNLSEDSPSVFLTAFVKSSMIKKQTQH